MTRTTAIVFCFSLLFAPVVSGADTSELNKELDQAVLFADPAMVDDLLSRGADPNHTERNRSMLGWAAQYGSAEVVQALVAAGANLNDVDTVGHTPLMRAVETLQLEVVRVLVSAGPDLDILTPDGRNIAMMSAETGNAELIQILLEGGADFDFTNEDGDSAALLVVQGSGDEMEKIIRLLGDAGADLNQSNAAYTPLYYAIEQGDIELVQLLLDAGADPNAQTQNGDVPLISSLSYSEITRGLLMAGADPNAANRWDETAIYSAIKHGIVEDLQVLIDAGADVNHANRSGQTPLQRADALNKPEMVEVLKKNGAVASAEW